jgi:hypothetical protein
MDVGYSLDSIAFSDLGAGLQRGQRQLRLRPDPGP